MSLFAWFFLVIGLLFLCVPLTALLEVLRERRAIKSWWREREALDAYDKRWKDLERERKTVIRRQNKAAKRKRNRRKKGRR